MKISYNDLLEELRDLERRVDTNRDKDCLYHAQEYIKTAKQEFDEYRTMLSLSQDENQELQERIDKQFMDMAHMRPDPPPSHNIRESNHTTPSFKFGLFVGVVLTVSVWLITGLI